MSNLPKTLTSGILADFPNLNSSNYHVTSARDLCYNCIWYAAHEDAHMPGAVKKWAWPSRSRYYPTFWPPQLPRIEDVPTFVRFFELEDYAVCDSADLEAGYEKVAIYVDAQTGEPTHAARQLPSGYWTSKLGGAEDITHYTLHALSAEGSIDPDVAYGKPGVFMKRKARAVDDERQ